MDQRNYFPFIDGLRGVAVLAVIAFHVNDSVLPGGFAGVDVFFVISGFVVSASAAEFSRGVGPFAAAFYARRVRRIVPALLVCLVATMAVSVVFIPPSGLSAANDRTGLMAFLAQSNRALVRESNDYFSPVSDYNPFAHTWSLGVEEQFYLLFPLVFVAWLRGGRWRRLSVAAVVGASLYTLLHARTLMEGGPSKLAFYSISTRLWQIGAGVLLYQLLARGGRDLTTRSLPRAWRVPILLASCAVLAYALIAVDGRHAPWPGGLAAVVGTVGILASLVDAAWNNPLKRVLSSRTLVAVGLMSYSLYLWHWPVLGLFRWTIGLSPPLHTVAAVALTAALAAASYFLVEQPIRRSRRLSQLPAVVVIALGLGALGAGYLVASNTVDQRPRLSRSAVVQFPEEWNIYLTPAAAPPGCGMRYEKRQFETLTVQSFDRSGCAGPANPHTLYVAGDSHAEAYFGVLRRFVLATGLPVRLASTNDCPFALGGEKEFGRTGVCADRGEEVVRYVAATARPGDVLFMPSLRLQPLSDAWASVDVAAALNAPESDRTSPGGADSRARTRELLAPVARLGVTLLFEAPPPMFAAPPFRCVDAYSRGNPICAPGFAFSRATLEQYRSSVVDAMRDFERTLPAIIWDPLPILCPTETCRARDEQGKYLFFDGHHLSAAGNLALTPAFVQTLTELMQR